MKFERLINRVIRLSGEGIEGNAAINAHIAVNIDEGGGERMAQHPAPATQQPAPAEPDPRPAASDDEARADRRDAG